MNQSFCSSWAGHCTPGKVWNERRQSKGEETLKELGYAAESRGKCTSSHVQIARCHTEEENNIINNICGNSS